MIFSVLLLEFFPSITLLGKPQNIILTGAQETGSYMFVKELARIWEASVKDRKVDIVPSPETSPVIRLRPVSYTHLTLPTNREV